MFRKIFHPKYLQVFLPDIIFFKYISIFSVEQGEAFYKSKSIVSYQQNYFSSMYLISVQNEDTKKSLQT